MNLIEKIQEVVRSLPQGKQVLSSERILQATDGESFVQFGHASFVMDSVEVASIERAGDDSTLVVLSQTIVDVDAIYNRYDLFTVLIPANIGFRIHLNLSGNSQKMAKYSAQSTLEEHALSLLVLCPDITYAIARLHVCKSDPYCWDIAVQVDLIVPGSLCSGCGMSEEKALPRPDNIVIYGLEGLQPQGEA